MRALTLVPRANPPCFCVVCALFAAGVPNQAQVPKYATPAAATATATAAAAVTADPVAAASLVQPACNALVTARAVAAGEHLFSSVFQLLPSKGAADAYERHFRGLYEEPLLDLPGGVPVQHPPPLVVPLRPPPARQGRVPLTCVHPHPCG